jgi:hypothetical protein
MGNQLFQKSTSHLETLIAIRMTVRKFYFEDPKILGVKIEASWNEMAQAQKTYFVIRRNGRVHLNRQGRQFIRLLAAEVCASAVLMLDTPCSEVVWRVLATHSIRQYPLYFPSRASPCVTTFQLESTKFIHQGELEPGTCALQFFSRCIFHIIAYDKHTCNRLI